MPSVTTGDMRQHFLTSRLNTSLKTDLNTLVQELTTGEASDLTAHLRGSQSSLAGLDRQIELLGRFSQANTETGQMLSLMQTALSGVNSQRETASTHMLTISDASTPSQLSESAIVARSSFEAVVSNLNLRSSDRAMFGGNDLETNPLADADVMLDALRSAISGLTTADDIETAIDTWFDTPGGGFETVGYLGDPNGTMSRMTGANEAVDISVRADDSAIRDTLKALAKGALSSETAFGLDVDVQQELQMQSAVDLLSTASDVVGLQASLGFAQGRVEEGSVRTSAQESSYGIARNELVSVDQYETASDLQSVQLQLETHYTLTARLSRLSLTEYLR
ncbi:MAG: flagellin [Octadecabacter sp.]